MTSHIADGLAGATAGGADSYPPCPLSVSSKPMAEREESTNEAVDPREEVVLDQLFDLLSEGPLSEAELIRRLEPDSEIWRLADDRGADPLDVLEDLHMNYEGFWTLPDRRIASVGWIVDGLVLTHRVTAEELDAGVLEDDVDYGALELHTRGVPLADGSGIVASQRSPITEGGYVLRGPEGWLDGVEPGELVGLRCDGRVLTVERVTEPDRGEAVSETLRELFDRRARPGIGIDLFPIVFDTIAEHHDRLRSPHLPLTELIQAAELRIEGEQVGLADDDWEPEYVVANRELRDRLARKWNLDACCDEELDRVITAWQGFLFENSAPDRRVAEALTHGSVAHAFVDRETSRHGMSVTLFSQHLDFASALVHVAGARAAGAFLLRALIHDADGRVIDAEADLERALTMDRGFVPVLFELAEFASERGDARRAMGLMSRAGMTADHPTLKALSEMLPDYPGVGRNDPCPCGSGRKFKVCCQQDPKVPPDARTRWLLAKIGRWVVQRHSSVLYGLGSSAVSGLEFEVSHLLDMADDPFIRDLAVFEGGLIEEYLESRGPLLEAEDRELVTAWNEAMLQVWDVKAVTSDQITILGARTGESVDVVPPAGVTVGVGETLLGRVGPSHDRLRFLGEAVAVDDRYRDRVRWLTDRWPDPDLMARWYGEIRFPPEVTNEQGHALKTRVAWLRPPRDLVSPDAMLDRYFKRIDGAWQLTSEVGGGAVLATLAWDGDALRAQADSEENLASVVVRLSGWLVVDQAWPDDEDFDRDDDGTF